MDYKAGEDVTISVVFRHDLETSVARIHKSFTLDSDIVAVVESHTRLPVKLLAFNMSSGKGVSIETDIPRKVLVLFIYESFSVLSLF